MGFKFCRQRDSMSCGIACLQMICRHYGHNIDQYSLSNLCVPTSEGVSLFSLIKTATQLGFNATSIRISINHFNSESLPCILHWNQNHFVVLYKVKEQKSFMSQIPVKDYYVIQLKNSKTLD